MSVALQTSSYYEYTHAHTHTHTDTHTHTHTHTHIYIYVCMMFLSDQGNSVKKLFFATTESTDNIQST